jgi:hypothetical protein
MSSEVNEISQGYLMKHQHNIAEMMPQWISENDLEEG